MIRLARTGLALIVLAATSARAADAAPPDACQVHVERARTAHAAEHYGEALEASRAAYACDPQPSLLFAMGQIAFNLEDYAAAESYYTRYLATLPDPEDAALALQALAVTRERIAAAARPPVPVRRADKVAWTLAIGSGVSLLAGAVLYGVARRNVVDTSGTYSDYVDRVDRARDQRIAAIVCGGVGAALAVAATIRWVRRSPEHHSAAIVPVAGEQVGIAIIGEL